jgi:hypothetical protein
MTDTANSSVDPFFNTLSDCDSEFVDGEILSESSDENKSVSSRRRLEEALERRHLEKDVQEFNFDF